MTFTCYSNLFKRFYGYVILTDDIVASQPNSVKPAKMVSTINLYKAATVLNQPTHSPLNSF